MKSYILAIVLGVLLGPLGVFYANFTLGFVMVLTAIVLAPTVVGALLMWLASPIVACMGVDSHNAKVRKEDEKFQRLLDATERRNEPAPAPAPARHNWLTGGAE